MNLFTREFETEAEALEFRNGLPPQKYSANRPFQGPNGLWVVQITEWRLD